MWQSTSVVRISRDLTIDRNEEPLLLIHVAVPVQQYKEQREAG